MNPIPQTDPHATDPDERIVRVLRRFPTDGPFAERAFALIQQYRRCTLQALAACGDVADVTERWELVEVYRLGLLGELGDLLGDFQAARAREGGAA